MLSFWFLASSLPCHPLRQPPTIVSHCQPLSTATGDHFAVLLTLSLKSSPSDWPNPSGRVLPLTLPYSPRPTYSRSIFFMPFWPLFYRKVYWVLFLPPRIQPMAASNSTSSSKDVSTYVDFLTWYKQCQNSSSTASIAHTSNSFDCLSQFASLGP